MPLRTRASPAPRRKPVSVRTRTAYHEAGHAVLSAAINTRPHHVSIRAEHGTLGRSGQRMLAEPASLAQVYLAGFAAEHLATGRRPRQYDLETELAILAHTDPDLTATFEGIASSDGYGAVRELLRTGVRAVPEEIRREVDRLYEVARESLSVIWPSAKALAVSLLTREEMDREAIDAVLGDVDIARPVLAVQLANGLHWPVPSLHAKPDGELFEAKMKVAKVRKKSLSKFRSARASDPRAKALLGAFRADPALVPVIDAYEKQTGEPGRKFGSNALKVNGKLFALFTQGTLVVKLPRDRVVALVASGTGEAFDPGHGRLMKEWLTVTSSTASWIDLAREAHGFVRGSKRS
jgi:hypothetical protein